MESDKVYFCPGDLVQVKYRDKIKSPNMIVLRKELSLFKGDANLKGIRCRWFTDSGLLQEAVFNSLDLVKV